MKIINNYLNWRKQNWERILDKEKFPAIRYFFLNLTVIILLSFPVNYLFNSWLHWRLPMDGTEIFPGAFVAAGMAIFFQKKEWKKQKAKRETQG